MLSGLLSVSGGIGLFLLGMAIMTEGLRTLAGGALAAALARFTRTPYTGAVTGSLATALLQSSSATTVATIGFVGAGVMEFEQALGVLFGANIGTTVTGWLSAVLGFKLQLGKVVMPLLLAGVLVRMFGRFRFRAAGEALAGFSLVFLGIAGLQGGMAGLQGVLTPDTLPADTLVGRLLLLALGVGITLVTQSSSGGVAMVLAALNAHAITLPQGLAMVIGMDVGTTATAALATIGGTVPARRTGMAHVIYNVLTGVGAFLLLTPYRYVVEIYSSKWSAQPEYALVAFHTGFNVLGVLLILPLTRPFARLIVRLFPEHLPGFARPPDRALLADPPLAVGAVFDKSRLLASAVFDKHAAVLAGAEPEQEPTWTTLADSCAELQTYLWRIHGDARAQQPRQVAAAHALDHIERMVERGQKQERVERVRSGRLLRGKAEPLIAALRALGSGGFDDGPAVAALSHAYDDLRCQEEQLRAEAIRSAIVNQEELAETLAELDALRWLRRAAQHADRVARHLTQPGLRAP